VRVGSQQVPYGVFSDLLERLDDGRVRPARA
jgi:hypothetical protein